MVSPAEIQQAGVTLRGGGLVAVPTETVYGLGAHALDPDAVARVFAAKGRPSFDPLIVHTASAEAAWALVDLEPLPPAQRPLSARLAEACWPGPLTLVLPKRSSSPEIRGGGVPGIVTSGLDTVGVRVPDHPVARALIEAAGVPIAAPSANPFGGTSPTRAQHVTVPCDHVLDGGPCATGVESTVLGFDDAGQPVVLRLGGTPVEKLEALLRRPIPVARAGERVSSPGMLDRHYAPRTPLQILPRGHDLAAEVMSAHPRIGALSLQGIRAHGRAFAAEEILSPAGDLTAAAAGLFEALHRLDAADLDLIVAQTVPEEGLGRAINDRLQRAAHPAPPR
ncbi:MAG: L-threonylcarbamoyladenylate synthase [Planctomycetota bacterium]